MGRGTVETAGPEYAFNEFDDSIESDGDTLRVERISETGIGSRIFTTLVDHGTWPGFGRSHPSDRMGYRRGPDCKRFRRPQQQERGARVPIADLSPVIGGIGVNAGKTD